jgi:hypothetical protein
VLFVLNFPVLTGDLLVAHFVFSLRRSLHLLHVELRPFTTRFIGIADSMMGGISQLLEDESS